MSKKKKVLAVLGATSLIGVTGTCVFLVMEGKNETEVPIGEDLSFVHLKEKAITTTANGNIMLYDIKTGQKIDNFDIKTLIEFEDYEIVEIPVQEPKPEVKPQSKPQEQETKKNLFHGFERFPISIKKGETVWGIQKKLTPNRNMNEMLRLLEDLNRGKALHPVYPGEIRIFLKEYIPTVEKPAETAKPAETKKEDVAVKSNKVKKTTKLDENAQFLYRASDDSRSLYAYNDKVKSFYEIKEGTEKLEAKVIRTDSSLKNVSDYKVINGELFFVCEGENILRGFGLSNPSDLSKYELNGYPDSWTIKDGFIYYTSGENIFAKDMGTGKEISAVSGAKGKDLFFAEDELYLVNEFGKNMNNSLIMKLDKNTLEVLQIDELLSSENKVITRDDSSNLFIGQIDTSKTLEGEIQKKPVVSVFKKKNLTKDLSIDNIIYNETSVGINGYIYTLRDSKLYIDASNGSNYKVLDIDGIYLTVY